MQGYGFGIYALFISVRNRALVFRAEESKGWASFGFQSTQSYIPCANHDHVYCLTVPEDVGSSETAKSRDKIGIYDISSVHAVMCKAHHDLEHTIETDP